MECHSEANQSLQVKEASKTDNVVKPYVCHTMKLQERFQADANLSYAHFHHEITKAVEEKLTDQSDDDHKARTGGNKAEDELVKYMSRLPSFLEKGKNVHEKAFSVGVLDWGRLERWQHSHRPLIPRNGRYSTSSSSTSSSFSTEGSSSHSSRGRSCSPHHQSVHRLTLQSHLLASSKDVGPQHVKPFQEILQKSEDVKIVHEKNSCGQHIDKGTVQINVRGKQEDTKKGELDTRAINKVETSPRLRNVERRSRLKEKTEIQVRKSANGFQKSQESTTGYYEPQLTERLNRVILLVPKDGPFHGQNEVSELSKSKISSEEQLAEARRRGILERCRGVHHPKLHPDLRHSCTLPCEFDRDNQSQVKLSSSMDADCTRLSTDVSHHVQRSARISCSAEGKNLETERPNVAIPALVPTSLRIPDPKSSNLTDEKVRSSSPFRRLNIGMGKIVQNSSSKEISASVQVNRKHASAKSDAETIKSSGCQDNSLGDKSNAAGRSKSSPLRRLLDPIMKLKSSNTHNCNEPFHESSVSNDKACAVSGRQSDFLAVQPAKVKLDLTNCRTINVSDSHLNKRQGSSPVQALLRVAVKNGHPLFTLAVDNDSDILAATTKKNSCSQKGNSNWIFFTFREVRRKNGSWIGQGGRSKGQDYISNVVAQMKVSDLCFSKLPSHLSMDQCSLLQYVLFSVDARQKDQQTTEFEPKGELAAIVVQNLSSMKKKSVQDGYENGSHNGSTEVDSRAFSSNLRRYFSHGENPEDQALFASEVLGSTTVVLPGGVHSLPSRGEPSSLVERWKSGGSCDCGGWDLGCELKILFTSDCHDKNLRLTKHSAGEQFALFSQAQTDAQGNQPVFSLAPFQDNVYSVEFNSSLSLLQAFSICIAVLDSRKLIDCSEMNDLSEVKSHGETASRRGGGIRPPHPVERHASVKYVSCPPLSPVGRV